MTSPSPTPRLPLQAALAIALALLALAAVLAVRTGLADYWSGVASQQLNPIGATDNMQAAESALRLAIRARPGIAPYWSELAMVESAANPSAALRDMRQALQLNPSPAESWYELGLFQFQLGDIPAALAALRQAEQHDPEGEHVHYEFANLARALGQSNLFFEQLHAAAAVMDPGFVFEILNAAYEARWPAADMLSLLPSHRPGQRAQGVLYFAYRHDWNTAATAFQSLGRCNPYLQEHFCHAAATQLLDGLSQQARTGTDAASAIAVTQAQRAWDHALTIGVLRGTPAVRGLLHDGDFQYPWLGVLFSWRDTQVLPSVVEPAAGPGGINAVRFDFSGLDRQQGSLLEQDLWITPGQRYRIALSSRDLAAPSERGVTADVVTPAGVILAQVTLPLQSQWSPADLSFRAPAHTSVVTLQIKYGRPNGETLLHRSVEIAALRMQPEEGGH
ncbi:MAG: hypothetical protein ACRD1C_04270 [Terriglobales bacterium]